MGRAIMNPDKTGFFRESQLVKEIINADKKTFKIKIIICAKIKYFLINLT
tara:strand:- start:336 stop:485 length:150 start_codon:yes stop_codon:yes gene_type:complete